MTVCANNKQHCYENTDSVNSWVLYVKDQQLYAYNHAIYEDLPEDFPLGDETLFVPYDLK